MLLAGCGGRGDPQAHEVAEWVLQKQGTLSIQGEQLQPTTVESLPARPFVIESINLQSAPVNDEDLEQLARLGGLHALNLYGTNVTDEGLMHLSGLRTLRELELSYTQVTDEGLHHLERLNRLEKLFLRGTAVTEDGARSLKRRLSNCRIYIAAAPLE